MIAEITQLQQTCADVAARRAAVAEARSYRVVVMREPVQNGVRGSEASILRGIEPPPPPPELRELQQVEEKILSLQGHFNQGQQQQQGFGLMPHPRLLPPQQLLQPEQQHSQQRQQQHQLMQLRGQHQQLQQQLQLRRQQQMQMETGPWLSEIAAPAMEIVVAPVAGHAALALMRFDLGIEAVDDIFNDKIDDVVAATYTDLRRIALGMGGCLAKFSLFGDSPHVRPILAKFKANFERLLAGHKDALARLQDAESVRAAIHAKIEAANEALRGAAALGATFFRKEASAPEGRVLVAD